MIAVIAVVAVISVAAAAAVFIFLGDFDDIAIAVMRASEAGRVRNRGEV